MAQGTRPCFYVPKIESHLEARLWNDVFNFAQDTLGIPRGTIRATVLIENILAAFEMHEILWELRDHSAGLNCGHWDYVLSGDLLMPTCHRRGAHAMGGMASQIPVKNDPAANERALALDARIRCAKFWPATTEAGLPTRGRTSSLAMEGSTEREQFGPAGSRGDRSTAATLPAH